MGTRTGARQAGGGVGLSSLSVNSAGLRQNTAFEAKEGQFDDSVYSTEVIYSGSNKDPDSRYNKDTVD